MRLYFVLILVLNFVLPLHGDWYPVSLEFGGSGCALPVENSTIKMKDCHITITAFEFAYGLDYDCRFVFENLTGKVQHVRMGFPVNEFLMDDGVEIKRENYVCDFAVLVDGSMCEFEEARSPAYDIVYIIDADFLPGKTKEIVTRYSLLQGREMEKRDKFFGLYVGMIDSSNGSINYILKTGALWANTIENLSITININGMYPEYFAYKEWELKGFKQLPVDKANPELVMLTFTARDYEPEQDLQLSFFGKDADAAYKQYLADGNYSRLEALIDAFYTLKAKYDRFRNWRIVSPDLFRQALYWTASNLLYKRDRPKAITYYLKAFGLVEDNRYGSDPAILLEKDLSRWERGNENKAPAYYIAYNLACAYSLEGDTDSAGYWLRIALRLFHTKIAALMKNDTDLAALRNRKELYNDILASEPQKISSLQDRTMAELTKIANGIIKTYVIDYTQAVLTNKLAFVYIPEEYAPYGVVMYYEALQPCVIWVIFERGCPFSCPIGEGSVDVEAGKGLVFVPLVAGIDPDWPELPEKWQESQSFRFAARMEESRIVKKELFWIADDTYAYKNQQYRSNFW